MTREPQIKGKNKLLNVWGKLIKEKKKIPFFDTREIKNLIVKSITMPVASLVNKYPVVYNRGLEPSYRKKNYSNIVPCINGMHCHIRPRNDTAFANDLQYTPLYFEIFRSFTTNRA